MELSPNPVGLDLRLSGKIKFTMSERIRLDFIESRLKIRQLVVFNAVLEQNSILKAAEQLNVTQPAVTRTIREMERMFSTSLFNRNNRGVTPTVFGATLGVRAKQILAELRYSVDELNSIKNAEEGHVIVGTLISASAELLPAAVAALKRDHPRVVVTVKEGTNDLLLPALANGEIDIVLGRIPDSLSYFEVDHYPLYSEPFRILVSSSHPLASESIVKFESLHDQQWIVPVSESPVSHRVKSLFEASGLKLPVRIVESLSVGTNLGLLRTLDAIVLLPGSVARYYAAMGDFKVLPVSDLGLFGDVGYSVSTTRKLNPSAERLVGYVREVASKIALNERLNS